MAEAQQQQQQQQSSEEDRIWDAVKELTKSAQQNNADPLHWAIQVGSTLNASSLTLPSVPLSHFLVSLISSNYNDPLSWKFLDKALSLKFVPPLLVLALLSTRLISSRRSHPAAYRLYLELYKRHGSSFASQLHELNQEKILEAIDDALHLSDVFGIQASDMAILSVLFVFSTLWQLVDASLDDEGLLEYTTHKSSRWLTGIQEMEIDNHGRFLENRIELQEGLVKKNTLMAIEMIVESLQCKVTPRILFLVRQNMPSHWKGFYQHLQLLASKSSLLRTSKHTTPETFVQIASDSCKQLDWQSKTNLHHQFHAVMTPECLVPSAVQCHGASCSSLWVPIDLFLEDAMEGIVVTPTCAIDTLTGMVKSLQALYSTTWHDTFLGLWIATLRLVQRLQLSSLNPLKSLLRGNMRPCHESLAAMITFILLLLMGHSFCPGFFCSMTTSDENNEMIHSEQADGEISPTENSLKVKPERVEPQTEGDQVESEHESLELAHPEPLGEDAVHPSPVCLEDVNPQLANSEESEHVHSEPFSSEHMQPQHVSSEHVQSPPASAEVVHSNQVNSEADHSQSGSADPAHSQPHGSLDENDEMVDAIQERETNFAISQTEDSVTVKPEHSQPESMDMETANSQPVGEQADPHAAGEEHLSAELAHPEPLGEEAIYSPSVGLEDVHPQLVNSDHVVGMESVHEQTVSPEHMHQSVSSGLMHPQPVSLEHMQAQPISSEHMQTQPVSSEHIQSHTISSEPVHPQTSAELVMSHPLSAEVVQPHSGSADLVYSQPISSDSVHSQPVSSEFVHSQPMDEHEHDHEHLQHGNMEPVHFQPIAVELADSHAHGSELVNSHAVRMELVNTQPLSTEVLNSEQPTPETQPSKRRKKKSIVWEHFTIETVGAGCRRAYCKVCKQSFAYSTGSKVAGTSHLKRHIAKGTCPVVLRQQEKNQLTPYMPKSGGTDAGTEHQPKRRYRSSSSPYLIFDQDRCRHEIAKMIIMHDYPLHMVEHAGFVSFVQNLQPRFDMVSFNIVQGDCVAIFLREKQNLQRFIEGIPGRICLTLDMVTSSQSTGYVFVTGQFIDNDWKLHRRLLNVVMEPFPESDRALSHSIGTCLSDWGLDGKLASITFNQPLGEAAVENLRALLAVKNSMLLDGQLLIRSCIARTLSSMAQEVITCSEETIKKIRTSVKYVKTSESHEEKFLELKQQLQVPTEKILCLDNITKWNTTYEMLLAASELKQVFSCLDTCDPDYKDAPSMEDWKQVENICMYLKLLYDTANLLTAKPTPSSNVFFHEVWKIQLELARAAASDDLFVAGLAKPLQERFHKYWKNSCLVLAVAVAMDPRFKMKLVEFSFTKIFMEEAPVFIRAVDEGIHELFHEYLVHPLPLTPLEDGTGGVKTEDQEGNILNSNGLADFDMYIMETTSQQMKSELDQYLEESLLPRIQDFDVLGWWKLNKVKYPTLSKMARDILSVPLSTVAVESVFDSSVKEMDPYRCSLRPETLEALICAKDWLQQLDSSKDSKQLVKMEL